MAGLDELIAKAKANKKILIPAAAIGGVLALVVISKNGIPGAGAGISPDGSGSGEQPTAPGAGGGADSGIGQAIQQLTDQLTQAQRANQDAINQIVSGQASYQDKISQALASVVSQLNDQLQAQQARVNEQIAGIQMPAQQSYGDLGQLFGQFANWQAPLQSINPEQTIRNAIPMSSGSGGGGKFGFKSPIPSSAPNVQKAFGFVPSSWNRALGLAQKSQTSYAQQLQSTFGRSLQTMPTQFASRWTSQAPSPGWGSSAFRSLNNQFAQGFNRASGSGSGYRYTPQFSSVINRIRTVTPTIPQKRISMTPARLPNYNIRRHPGR